MTLEEKAERNKKIVADYSAGMKPAQLVVKYSLSRPRISAIVGGGGKAAQLANHANGKMVKFSPTDEARIEVRIGTLTASVVRGDIESLRLLISLAKEAA